MEKIIRNGEVVGYVMVGFVMVSFWGYFIFRNTNFVKFVGKMLRGGKMRW